MTFIDLTHPIADQMPVFPGDPTVKVEQICSLPADGCRITALSFGSHTGTHMDAPSHMLTQGRTLSDLPPGTFFGRAKVFPGEWDLSKEELSGLDYVLLSFDWEEKWGSDGFYQCWPVLSPENANLLASLPLKGVGVDTPSVDGLSVENHLALLGSGKVILECLRGLKPLLGREFFLTALPLNIQNCDGAPCRVAACLEELL